jgi:hypothetical protein
MVGTWFADLSQVIVSQGPRLASGVTVASQLQERCLPRTAPTFADHSDKGSKT